MGWNRAEDDEIDTGGARGAMGYAGEGESLRRSEAKLGALGVIMTKTRKWVSGMKVAQPRH